MGKSLVAERLKKEDIRNKLVTDEIVKMKRNGPRASSAQRRAAVESLFPTTTNQEMHNDDVHGPRPIDKANFKKKNPFSAYVNSIQRGRLCQSVGGRMLRQNQAITKANKNCNTKRLE